MGLREAIAKIVLGNKKGYMLGGASSYFYTNLEVPPAWGYQSYLRAYGEVGWLFACVNVIAQAVAKVRWHLYQIDKEGERKELFNHDLATLLKHINPFQTWYQFIYLGTMYKLLVGEEFWVLNFDGRRKPNEIWLAPPGFIIVFPSSVNYIDHYEYKRGNFAKNFTIEEIIHIKTPNPLNEYRGMSPAQSLTLELDIEKYAAQYQQRFFYNNATPGFILEYPATDMPTAEQRKELMQEWDERYGGIRSRGKTAFLFGAKANVITMTNKDMDFEALRKFNRDAILGAYHVPKSIVGITEDVNRANAEAAQYTFAQYCIHPELSEIREALNSELCPLFGDNLILDFENPVPEDETMNVNNAVNLFKNAVINRNEARIYVGMDTLDDPMGDEYFSAPASPFGLSLNMNDIGIKALEPLKVQESKLRMLETEEQIESFWKDYVESAETFEGETIQQLKELFMNQKEEALGKLEHARRNSNLIDLRRAKKDYTARMMPILIRVMAGAIKNGLELVKPPTPHKDIEPLLNVYALKWLKTRIGWAAAQIGEESAGKLAQILAYGLEQGESIAIIRGRIESEFDIFSRIRAERIARTEIMQASAQGTVEGYRDAGVEKVRFYAALDERACDDCMSLHNQEFTIDDSEGIITVHPDCRCVWLAVI